MFQATRLTQTTLSLTHPVGLFSTASKQTLADKHRTKHQQVVMDPSFYEDVFVPTTIEELDFVRTPFYDLAKLSHLKEGEDAQEFVTNLQLKSELVDVVSSLY